MGRRSMSKRRAAEVYRDLHWGRDPDRWAEVEDPRFAGETLVALGELVSVTYRTEKGDEVETDWQHEFGDDGEGPDLPLLCVDGAGHLAVLGGTYEINTRGIVG